jgi:hypothetical protein
VSHLALVALLLGMIPALEGLEGQDPAAREAYFRVVSEQFQVSVAELQRLTEAGARDEELPVLLRVSRTSGISPTVLLALRRRGDSWLAIARRYGLGASIFYVAMTEDQVDDRIRRAHGLYRDTPENRWNTLSLSDEEVVVLANLQVLTRGAGASPGRILEARSRAGSFPGALRMLAQRP